jgi:hypothetical protein
MIGGAKMANQCLFKRIHPTGYNYLMFVMTEQDLCSKCPCSSMQCIKSTSGSECDKKLNEESFNQFLIEVTGLDSASLEDELGDFEHQRRIEEHQRYIQRLTSKTRVMVKKDTSD